MSKRKKMNWWIIGSSVGVGVLVLFLIFVGVRMATMDATVEVVLDYNAPDNSFDGISYEVPYGQWAVALNGKTVASSSEFLPTQSTASTAKMITALAVMEKRPFKLGETGEAISITEEMYDKYAWYVQNNGSNSRVIVGEEISEYDALASALVVSSNNMADSLAIWAFGSLEEYRTYAAEMLARMGATHTVIGSDASGFDESTVSTAEDLALIGEAVLRQPVLAEIVGRTEVEVPVAGTLYNTNKLLGTNGIVGVKTGFIGDPSGYCLVSGYLVGHGEIVTVALLGAPTRQTSFEDSLGLVLKAQDAIRTRTLVDAGTEVGRYESWWIGEVPIMTEAAVSGVAVSEIQADFNGDVSELVLKTDETSYTVPVSAENFPKEPTFWQKFLHVFGWKAE